jgi:hypothetical protein
LSAAAHLPPSPSRLQPISAARLHPSPPRLPSAIAFSSARSTFSSSR